MWPDGCCRVSEPVLLVRRGGILDAKKLRSIRLEALADEPDAFGASFDDVVKWTRVRWLLVALRWNYYLGSLDGEVVGMATGGGRGQRSESHWLFGMYVSPRARGTGLAALLVGVVEDWVLEKGGDALFLHVTESVPRARAFYNKVGFKPTGDTFAMERDPSLRLVTMVKHLV